MNHDQSHALFSRAQQLLPGGVNSPVRAFKSVGGEPFFVERADGAYLYDVDGNRYIDYVGSWGPMIVGHNHPAVRRGEEGDRQRPVLRCAVRGRSDHGRNHHPLGAIVRDGAHGQLRHRGHAVGDPPARGATGRNRIVKFEGCYHGHGDSFLVKAGSGMLTLGVPTSPGVPAGLSELTLTLPYNDFEAATALFEQQGGDIAGLIIEPVVGNANCIPPREGYLQHLRALCTKHGALLIFDEVMTGFRVALGGAQAHYGITPDLTTFGKIIGGGMPVGAYGGRRELMQQIAPAGPIYQAGTLSGNPVAMAAGPAMLELIQQPGFHADLAERTARLCAGLEAAAADAGVAVTTTCVGAMFGLFFTSEKVETYAQATACDIPAFNRFFHAMLEQGVFLAPSAYEAGFLSSAHDDAVIEATLAAARVAFKAAKG